MHKSISILVGLFVILQGNLVWGEPDPAQEKSQREFTPRERSHQESLEFRKSLSKGDVGRFQAVSMDNSAVFIVDTKQAHLWVFRATGSGFYLVYGGQIYPGLRVGEIIDSSSLKLQKGQFFTPREEPEQKPKY